MVSTNLENSDDKLPSCGGNGGHRISVVCCPIGSLHPAAHRIAAANLHRCFFLLQMDPQVPSSDRTSAPKKSPEARGYNCWNNSSTAISDIKIYQRYWLKLSFASLMCMWLTNNTSLSLPAAETSPAALFSQGTRDRRS